MTSDTISPPDAALSPLRSIQLKNPLAHYYTELAAVLRSAATQSHTQGFDPGYELPVLDERLAQLFAPSTIRWHALPPYSGRQLSLLDLRGNPGTRTTKTMASLLMVARAAAYIRRTGERIVIVTPSSGNKATALRDAVCRAISIGLVDPDQLQIVCVVPAEAREKLWNSPLATDLELRRRNPMLFAHGDERVGVKTIVQRFATTRADEVVRSTGVRLWFTMALGNYLAADVVRAFVEQDCLPPPTAPRLHAHAVSSAFGLLGHAHGWDWRGGSRQRPGYFLVQHLDTPDMVLDLYQDSFDRAGMPDYTLDLPSGMYTQSQDAHFPQQTHSPKEVLEPTFYTHAPATSPQMKRLIREQGGGGIVVSLAECLQRYSALRSMLSPLDIQMPADPRQVREWSLPMALTGVLNAIDRGVIPADHEVMVHASGFYGVADFDPMPAEALSEIRDENDLAEHVRQIAHLPAAN